MLPAAYPGNGGEADRIDLEGLRRASHSGLCSRGYGIITRNYPGVEMKRKWPIGVTSDVLGHRWRALLISEDRKTAFKEADRKVDKSYRDLEEPSHKLEPLQKLRTDSSLPELVPYSFRSLDRHWLIKDARLGDRMRPPLWLAYGIQQIYMTSLLTKVLGPGPAATVTNQVPDRDHFSGRGGKDVIPLWRDADATEPNVTSGLLDRLSEEYGQQVEAEELFAYAYAVLVCRSYTEKFSEELLIPGPRLPLTKDHALFERGARLGRDLIFLHTYGERFSADGSTRVPRGSAENTKAIPESSAKYPETYEYDPANRTLRVGEGEIYPVAPQVWEYEVSGLRVLNSWLAYRKREPYGRSSSPLDEIRPERWTGRMTRELLELIWVLEATVDKEPELREFLEAVTDSDLFAADELPEPTGEEREPPKGDSEPHQLSL